MCRSLRRRLLFFLIRLVRFQVDLQVFAIDFGVDSDLYFNCLLIGVLKSVQVKLEVDLNVLEVFENRFQVDLQVFAVDFEVDSDLYLKYLLIGVLKSVQVNLEVDLVVLEVFENGFKVD